MSTPPPGSVRHRGGKKKHGQTHVDGSTDTETEVIAKPKPELEEPNKSEWDYKLAIVVLTILAFVTRFYGITHPNQVVFDEVHFGKVGFDVHYILN
jgi:dolichyl-phosphate-mannose-protein mannosyltransferase